MLRLQQTLLHGFNIKCTKMQIRQFILQGGAKKRGHPVSFQIFRKLMTELHGNIAYIFLLTYSLSSALMTS